MARSAVLLALASVAATTYGAPLGTPQNGTNLDERDAFQWVVDLFSDNSCSVWLNVVGFPGTVDCTSLSDGLDGSTVWSADYLLTTNNCYVWGFEDSACTTLSVGWNPENAGKGTACQSTNHMGITAMAAWCGELPLGVRTADELVPRFAKH